ncbi:hypothetical protein [Nocardia bovistercoris]|uniref:Uncharacterized protein n=1 Tax=Nocardia bovistercoris TaxID=2785916 RepID=A0A931N119_9NOCA|nr:hypothetical protein [Nocardia bovistercoris]MBH0777905.1 hypothetical protein [Nocardia bovistercoris]
MRWWKAVGLAGAAGVVATGVVVVRAERRRRAYTPDQVREQLQARFAEVATAEEVVDAGAERPGRFAAGRARLRRLIRRD